MGTARASGGVIPIAAAVSTAPGADPPFFLFLAYYCRHLQIQATCLAFGSKVIAVQGGSAGQQANTPSPIFGEPGGAPVTWWDMTSS